MHDCFPRRRPSWKRSAQLSYASLGLLAGFVRSGTGWGMGLSLQGEWMFLRQGLIITWGTWGGIYNRMLFSPADGHPWQYLHGWILVNPGKSWFIKLNTLNPPSYIQQQIRVSEIDTLGAVQLLRNAFLADFDLPSPCHKVSHRPEPPPPPVT